MLIGESPWSPATAIADDVNTTVRRLEESTIWWRRSENEGGAVALGCRAAVRVRERLGSGRNGGIPLWAELKSIVGCLRDRGGTVVCYWAAHTRANTTIDLARVAAALDHDPTAVSVELLFDERDDPDEFIENGSDSIVGKDSFSAPQSHWFGRVNPFLIDRVLRDIANADIALSDIVQMIDTSLDMDGGVPDTVLTNIGDRTHAFELRAGDVATAIRSVSPNSVKAAVSSPDPIWLGLSGRHRRDYWLTMPPPCGPKIGILTGNGPDSGRMLWSDLLDALRKKDRKTKRSLFPYLPDVLSPAVVINSVPAMGLSMELVDREPQVRRVVQRGIQDLLDIGCQIIALACNTTIYYTPMIKDMCASRGADFLSIAEASVPAIRAALDSVGPTPVGLVGIGPVIALDASFSGYREPLATLNREIRGFPVGRLAFAVKSLGAVPGLVTPFRQAMDEIPEDVRVVVLALTELSILFRDHVARQQGDLEDSRRYIDPLHELGRALAYTYLVRGYRESQVCQIHGVDVETKLAMKFGWKEPPKLG